MNQRKFSRQGVLVAAALACALGGALAADPLPKPASVTVELPGPNIRWSPVDGAQVYRVAVFDEPDSEGKRPLLAAVWVAGNEWAYGKGAVLERVAHLASTKALPLPAGHALHVMVAAAGEDGADKSDWTGADLQLPARAVPAPSATPSPTVSPTPGPLSPTAGAAAGAISGSADAVSADAAAELDLSGTDEFKSSPEPAVLDLAGDGAKSAVVAAAAAPPSVEGGKALLRTGKDEEAEAAFRAVLDKDATNADAWEGVGDSYADRRMKVEAAEAYEKALKLDKSKTRLRDWLDANVRP